MTDYDSIVDTFKQRRVLVLGDAMLDTYLRGVSERLCPEAPVPVVDVTERSDSPGGAANVAVNLQSLGAQAWLITVVGNDREGDALAARLSRAGVACGGVIRSDRRRTLAKTRISAAGQVLVRFDQGDTAAIEQSLERHVIETLQIAFPCCDALIISDYGYGIVTPAVIAMLAKLQAEHGKVIVADSKRLAMFRDVGLTAVKPNFRELTALLCGDIAKGSRVEAALAATDRVLDITGAKIAALTLDVDGAVVCERGRPVFRMRAQPCPSSRAAGAGDTYTSALALALSSGVDTEPAAQIASAAAAVVVAKEGTSVCGDEELRHELFRSTAYHTPVVDKLRFQQLDRVGKRIVFTNGCFDILHSGHVTFLRQARSLGDVLVVAVNSDESIRRLKGVSRPINSLADRLQVLAALDCVDFLLPFEEDTPHAAISRVQPHVFVKGGDYTRERLSEADLVESLGGEIHILPYVTDRSTTGMIERICRVSGSSRLKRSLVAEECAS